MNTVKIIQRYWTSEKTIQDARNFLVDMGKDSVLVNKSPGFVSNRIFHLFMNEAIWVVQDQVPLTERVDDIFKILQP